jgi:drug/metabolite transporter (DMT)-like permease
MVAIAASSWGLWPLILNKAESYGKLDSTLESLVVMVALTIASAPLMLRDRVRVRAPLRAWLAVGWLGIADALNVVLFFRAYQTTSVAIAVVTHYLTPLFVALAAPLLLAEKARARTYVTTFAGFVGLVILLRPWAADREPGDLLGGAFGAASAVFYASNVIVNKRLAGTFSGSELMFFHGLVAVPLLMAFVPHDAWSHVTTPGLGWVCLGSAGPGATAGLLFVWGLRRVPASHASTLTLLEPLVAVVCAALWMRQIVTTTSMLGGAIILASAALVVSRNN